ncbi:unnamed protein product [Ambrosiozyma monospora]|uniref:Unnamed protein product n=1 Tax=Ambrosiozyma monospora TaxID=43982 RepID=A0ACB5U274_AMBMO|nr:unnamed protein product [Ambrosiozyma monospora]
MGVSQMGSFTGIVFPIMLRGLYPKLGYTKTMIILASICVGLCVLSLVLVKDRNVHIADSETKEKSLWRNMRDMLDIAYFKDKTFTLATAALFFNEFSILLVITYISTYALVRGMTESKSYILLTVLNSASLVGKIVPNVIGDYIGRFNVMILVLLLMAISIFAVWLPYYNTTGLFIFAVLYGFGFGGSYSLTATVISQISHTKKFASRFATSYFIVAFGNLISMPLGSQFINNQTIANYNRMIIFAGAACIASVVFMVWARFMVVGLTIKKFV